MNDSPKDTTPDCGPMRSALHQIRELGKNARWQKRREETGEVEPLPEVEPGTRAYSQMGMRAEGIVQQVLDEMERTDPAPKEPEGWASERDVVVLSSNVMPTGLAPPEVTVALTEQSAAVGARVEAITWQLNRIGEDTVLYLVYAYRYEDEDETYPYRASFIVQLNGETTAAGTVG
jgi:hypothetical protein